MGTVYLAEDKTVGQQVAIKVVRTDDDEAYAEMISSGEAAERFRQEARAVASLDHLHILPLYRYGEEVTIHGTRAYMVMQYRPEGSLLDWQKKRAGKMLAASSTPTIPSVSSQLPPDLPTDWPLNVEEAVEYLRQAASALQYAHDHGIIHRDVKPANFLLRFDTNPSTNKHSAFLLLSDFGLAKFFSSSSATTNILGTPTYMAPEQFNGNAEPASDQYALAIMIYYLLAGRPPFVGDPIHLLTQHLNTDPPPIRTFAPTLSAGIEQVLTRALSKKPSERYPSISAFAETFIECMHQDKYKMSGESGANHTYHSLNTHKSTLEGSLQQILTKQSTIPQTPQPTTEERTALAFSQRDSVSPTLLQHTFSPGPSSSPLSSAHSQQTISAHTPPPRSENLSGPIPSTPNIDHRTSRRRALSWIVGGITMLGLGVGAGLGISIYEKHTPSNQQQNSPVTPPTPVASNTVEPQNTPSYITYILRGHSGKVTSQGNRILILKAQNLEEVLIAPASLEPFGFDPHLCRFFLP
jgi:serine/threonine protein kinase